MTYVFAFFGVVLFPWQFAMAMVDDKDTPKRTIRLSLEAMDKTIKKGDVPKFKLTIQNLGKADERILDLRDGRRGDLQDTYYDIEITQGGKPVKILRAISDPGPIEETDFLKLKTDETVTFELTRFAVALGKLPPGKYQARIRFWQDPFQSAKKAVLSPDAEFTVGK